MSFSQGIMTVSYQDFPLRHLCNIGMCPAKSDLQKLTEIIISQYNYDGSESAVIVRW